MLLQRLVQGTLLHMYITFLIQEPDTGSPPPPEPPRTIGNVVAAVVHAHS